MNKIGNTAQCYSLRSNSGALVLGFREGTKHSGECNNTKKQPGVVVHTCAHTCNSSSSSRELTGSQAPGQCMLHSNTLSWNPRQQKAECLWISKEIHGQWRNSLAGNKSNKDSICFTLKNWIRQQRICCFSGSPTRIVWAINTRGRKDKIAKEREADADNLNRKLFLPRSL